MEMIYETNVINLQEENKSSQSDDSTIHVWKNGKTQISLSKLSLPTVLRWTGTLTIIVAAILFMLQGIDSVSFMWRHWIFTGVTICFGILGILLGLKLEEYRGARTFLGLTLCSVPVLFSQSGGMLHTIIHPITASMPKMFISPAVNLTLTIITIAVTSLVTLPFVFTGFRIFARKKAHYITAIFYLFNASILLPCHNNSIVGIVIFAQVLGLLFFDKKIMRKDLSFNTFEGLLTRLILHIPLGIIAVRSFFYDFTSGYYALVFAGIGIWLLFHGYSLCKPGTAKKVLQWTGMILISLSSVVIVTSITGSVRMDEWVQVYLFILPAAITTAIASYVQPDISAGKGFRAFSAIMVFLSVAFARSFGASVSGSIVAIIAGVTLLCWSYFHGQKSIAVLGFLCSIPGIGNCLWTAVGNYNHYGWLALVITGIAVLGTASLFEKRKDILLKRYTLVKKRYSIAQ